MWQQRRDSVRAPDPQMHRGQQLFELISVIPGEQSKSSPFAWFLEVAAAA
jgi:hypothetical protein